MKNLLLIATAFLTINASAQQIKKEGQKAEVNERMEMRQQMTPEETAQIQTKKLTLSLDLTEKQQVEVENVLLDALKIRKSKMEAFKVKKDKTEGEKISKDERLELANDRLDHQIEFKNKMKVILNTEQYAEFEKIQEKRKGLKRNAAKMIHHKD